MNRDDDDTPGDDDERVVLHARHLFDDSVDGLDAATRSRLNRARQQAVAALRPRRTSRTLWLPAAGVAAAALVAVALWDGRAPLDAPHGVTAAVDLELLLDEASLEMLEDLEFYSWLELEAQDERAADRNVG